MRLEQIGDALKKRIRERGLSIDDLALEEGIVQMLTFYQEVRVNGCRLEAEGDMLLYQWGRKRLDYEPVFVVDITRQLKPSNVDEPCQLSLRFCFATEDLDAMGEGNEWCGEPADLDAFKRFIDESEAFEEARQLEPAAVELMFDA